MVPEAVGVLSPPHFPTDSRSRVLGTDSLSLGSSSRKIGKPAKGLLGAGWGILAALPPTAITPSQP